MAWGTTPTVDGQISFAKGRLRKWATSVEGGARLRSQGDRPEVNDPGGLTAHMTNGTKVVVHRGSRSYREGASYVVLGRDGQVIQDFCTLGGAVAKALGGARDFLIGHSKVSVSVYFKSAANRVRLYVNLTCPNAEAEFESSRLTHAWYQTSTTELVVLAVGLLADDRMNDPSPLLDRIQELDPGKIDRAVGFLLAEPVPPSRLKKMETRFADDGCNTFQKRYVYLDGRPVEGPDGEWRDY